MSSEMLQSLRDAGVPVDQLPEGQREVFAGLSEDEAAVVMSIQARLDAIEPEVEGQSAIGNTNNNLC